LDSHPGRKFRHGGIEISHHDASVVQLM
jgi:hypothetical protein